MTKLYSGVRALSYFGVVATKMMILFQVSDRTQHLS